MVAVVHVDVGLVETVELKQAKWLPLSAKSARRERRDIVGRLELGGREASVGSGSPCLRLHPPNPARLVMIVESGDPDDSGRDRWRQRRLTIVAEEIPAFGRVVPVPQGHAEGGLHGAR